MRKVITTTRFERALVRFAHQHPQFKTIVREIMRRITDGDPAVRVHALHGQLKSYHAASVSQQYRLVFALEPNAVIFINIGSHNEVY